MNRTVESEPHLRSLTPVRGPQDGADGQSGDSGTSVFKADVWRQRRGAPLSVRVSAATEVQIYANV